MVLAALRLQTRQESWSYPDAVAGALFLLTGAVPPLSVLPDALTITGALFVTGALITLGATVIFRSSERRARDRGLLDRTTGSQGPVQRPWGAQRGAAMRIYEGSPRQDFEEVFRSIGAFLDARGMRDILLLEVPDGFVVQGLVMAGGSGSAWSETIGSETKETLTFVDDDIARFMEEAASRRGAAEVPGAADAGHERALRVIGRWMDEQKPRDVFLFELEGAYVIRLLIAGQAGSHHELAEFTRDDIAALMSKGPTLRDRGDTPGS